jgi:hypothetical protein
VDKNDQGVSYPEQICQLQYNLDSGKGRPIKKGLQDAKIS